MIFLLSLLFQALLLTPVHDPAPSAFADTTYTVWVFMDTECPVSQSYTLTLRNLHRDYAPRGVVFRGIYDSPTVKRGTVRRFHKKYSLPFRGEIDKAYALARRWDATITPEVVLTNPQGQILYRGAIDNWYYALGKTRPEPTEHFLKDALDAVLSNTPILTRRTEAIGCLMNR